MSRTLSMNSQWMTSEGMCVWNGIEIEYASTVSRLGVAEVWFLWKLYSKDHPRSWVTRLSLTLLAAFYGGKMATGQDPETKALQPGQKEISSTLREQKVSGIEKGEVKEENAACWRCRPPSPSIFQGALLHPAWLCLTVGFLSSPYNYCLLKPSHKINCPLMKQGGN